MSTPAALIQRLYYHRAWVNQNLRNAAAPLTDQHRNQTFAIGQGSIWKSLVHMYAAEYVWLEAMLGNDDPCCPGDLRGMLPGNQLGEGAIHSFAELCEKWESLESRWKEHLATLSAESLDDPVYKVSASENAGQRFVCTRSDGMFHVCLHAHYTAAQVVNMLRQLGVEKLPKTMMISLAWRKGQEQSA